MGKPLTKYTRHTLLNNERILYAGKLHPFSRYMGILLMGIGLLFLFPPDISGARVEHPYLDRFWYYVDLVWGYVHNFLASLPEELYNLLITANEARQRLIGTALLAMGFFTFTMSMIRKISVEQAITTRKVIYKRGLVEVNEVEIPLDHVEGVKVKQSALDRIIHRGNILITGIGMEHMEIKRIKDPNQFRQETYKAIDMIKNPQNYPELSANQVQAIQQGQGDPAQPASSTPNPFDTNQNG